MWKPIILDVECIVCNKSLHKINHDPREIKRKMGKITNRRSRTPNWSVEEKQYLLELIKERKEVVVVKTTNGPNHYEEKDVAWNDILVELSAKFGNKFNGSSIKKVKTQWQNMKRIAREEITLNGPELGKYTKQSFEVCGILGLIKDGVLIAEENLNVNVSAASSVPNVEIKAERIDEEINQPSCSTSMEVERIEPTPRNSPALNQNEATVTNQLESSTSSMSELEHVYSEVVEYEIVENAVQERQTKSVAANTDPSVFDENTMNHYHRNLEEFFRFTTVEKQLKMDSLKEERQVVRAMRETAELNKIIAEQRLKHVLWIKKKEIEMYSEKGGESGKAGAIREAGGAFGKMEAAREDEYFYKQQKQQLEEMKKHMNKEIAFHQEQIKRHEDAIRRQKEQMATIEKK